MNSTGSSNAAPEPRADAPIRLLVIDDQPFVGLVVGRLLDGERDIELHCCHTAKDAIPRANVLRPALIFQDLLMPEVDGVTLVRLFRRNEATARTPIVVLSGNDDAEARARAAAAGADEYMVKLPEKDALLECIDRYVRGRVVPATTAATAPRSTPPPDVTLDRSLIDAIRGAAGAGSQAVVTTVIDGFLEEAASLLESLARAARQQAAANAVAAAHSLKGSAATIGARRLARLSAELEDAALRDPSALRDGPLCAALHAEFGRLRAALTLEKKVQT